MKKITLTVSALLLCLSVSLCGCEPSGNPDDTSGENDGTSVPSETTVPDNPDDGHVCEFGDWSVGKEATCTENGLRVRTCECGKREEESVPAAHIYYDTVILPTVSAEGSTKHTCRVCGNSYSDTKTPVLTASAGLEFMDNPTGDGVVVKGIGTFSGTDVVIPASDNGKAVTGIWVQAFYGNDKITSVTIPEGVTFISGMAFDNCKKLKTVSFPSTLKDIGEYAFFGCESLEFAVLQEGLETIGKCAFSLDSAMKSAVMPVSVKNIGDSAFSCCTNLAYIAYAGTEADFEKVEKPENWNYLCRYLEMYYAK